MSILRERQRVAAYGVARRDGCTLLARASSLSALPGSWWLPGGGVEFGESPDACVAREFAEETGLSVRVKGVLDVMSDVTDLPALGERLHSVRVIYAVAVRGGTLRTEVNGTTDLVAWLRAPEVNALPLMAFVRRVLNSG